MTGNPPLYYNTNKERGLQLLSSKEQAKYQEGLIFRFFFMRPKHHYTPFQVKRHIFELRSTPITSVRRAITNLTKRGLLIKTDVMAIGDYGKPNHTWILNRDWKKT